MTVRKGVYIHKRPSALSKLLSSALQAGLQVEFYRDEVSGFWRLEVK